MPKRNDVSVKMDAEVVKKCRLAADFREKPLAEYISESMLGVALKDIADGIARFNSENSPKESKSKPKGKEPK